MGEDNADPHPAASLLAFGLRFVDRENVFHLFLLCARCSRASDPLPDFVEILAAVVAVEKHLELYERNALRTAATVVLEEGTDLAGASIEHWARPELLARVQDPSMEVQMITSTGSHVTRTFGNRIAAGLVEVAGLSRAASVSRRIGCPGTRSATTRMSVAAARGAMISILISMGPQVRRALIRRLTCKADLE